MTRRRSSVGFVACRPRGFHSTKTDVTEARRLPLRRQVAVLGRRLSLVPHRISNLGIRAFGDHVIHAGLHAKNPQSELARFEVPFRQRLEPFWADLPLKLRHLISGARVRLGRSERKCGSQGRCHRSPDPMAPRAPRRNERAAPRLRQSLQPARSEATHRTEAGHRQILVARVGQKLPIAVERRGRPSLRHIRIPRPRRIRTLP